VAILAKESGTARSGGRGGGHRRRPKAWGKNMRLRAMVANVIGYPTGRGPPLYSVHPNRSPSKWNGCDRQRTNGYMSHQSPSQRSNLDGPGGDTTSASQAPRRHNSTEWQPPSQGGGDQFRIHGPPNPTAISKGGNCWGINSP
jgi:hypothetical protein